MKKIILATVLVFGALQAEDIVHYDKKGTTEDIVHYDKKSTEESGMSKVNHPSSSIYTKQ